jgi:hypothetical protein
MELYKLKRETLITALEYMDKMLYGIETIVEYFQSGREDKATTMMLDLIEGLDWLVKAIEGTKDLQGEHAIDISIINPIFSQLIEAYENLDYVFISDLLEYEVVPIVSGWKNQLQKVEGVIENGSIG